jgi:hypothetical protein
VRLLAGRPAHPATEGTREQLQRPTCLRGYFIHICLPHIAFLIASTLTTSIHTSKYVLKYLPACEFGDREFDTPAWVTTRTVRSAHAQKCGDLGELCMSGQSRLSST